MAERRTKKTNKAPKENKYGIDRWTSNGYGIVMKDTPKKKTTKKRGK